MHCVISEERNHEKAFAVCLLLAPEFPTDAPLKKYTQTLIIIAANNDKGAWEFVTITKPQKDCIGFEMMQFGADIGKWYWCELHEYENL